MPNKKCREANRSSRDSISKNKVLIWSTVLLLIRSQLLLPMSNQAQTLTIAPKWLLDPRHSRINKSCSWWDPTSKGISLHCHRGFRLLWPKSPTRKRWWIRSRPYATTCFWISWMSQTRRRGTFRLTHQLQPVEGLSQTYPWIEASWVLALRLLLLKLLWLDRPTMLFAVLPCSSNCTSLW